MDALIVIIIVSILILLIYVYLKEDERKSKLRKKYNKMCAYVYSAHEEIKLCTSINEHYSDLINNDQNIYDKRFVEKLMRDTIRRAFVLSYFTKGLLSTYSKEFAGGGFGNVALQKEDESAINHFLVELYGDHDDINDLDITEEALENFNKYLDDMTAKKIAKRFK